MDNTLEKTSGIWLLKSRFFLIRLVTYFGFLLIPVWLQKSGHIGQASSIFVMAAYICFLCSQWFLLGKEIDHRLKIYFRVNSSIDRVVYRLFLGKFFFIIYFNLVSFLPGKWIYNTFWITWVILGLFYSWPTRGKIIRESVTTNFSEFRYLDSFEKTLFFLTLTMFIFSIPEFPKLNILEALKLFFDHQDQVSPQLWEFLKVTYYPFYKYPDLFRLAWSLHFYLIGTGFFLLTFYALLRFFVSRRLSLLGVFAFVSSWSFSKILVADYGSSYKMTFSLLWVWTSLWVIKSYSYRAGLFLGLVGYFGTLINQSWIFLSLIQIIVLYFFFLKEQTEWARKQLIRYYLFGFCLNILVLLSHSEIFHHMRPLDWEYLSEVKRVFNRKAFFILSFFGAILYSLKRFVSKINFLDSFKIEEEHFNLLMTHCLILIGYSLFFDAQLVKGFFIMWVLIIFSLIPLELVFQSIRRLRSNRNMIYLVYILVCLLDSHFEGRVKIFLKIFE